MLLKKETDCTDVVVSLEKSDILPRDHCRQHVLDAYKQLYKISGLPSVFSLMTMLFTIKVNMSIYVNYPLVNVLANGLTFILGLFHFDQYKLLNIAEPIFKYFPKQFTQYR